MEYNMSREFVTLPSFDVKWERLGFSMEDLKDLENELLKNPKLGDVIKGTKKGRKLRVAFDNRSKSRSARVIYVDFEFYEKLYFLDVYAKNEQTDLSSEDKKFIKKIVEVIELSLEDEPLRG